MDVRRQGEAMHRHPTALAICLATAATLLAGSAFAADGTPCTRSAQNAFHACGFAVRDDLNIEIAKCRNISDGATRRACFAEARSVAAEDRDGCADQLDARLDICDRLDEFRYDPPPLGDRSGDAAVIDPNEIGQSVDPNPFLSLAAGTTEVRRTGPGDGDFPETDVVFVTPDVRMIDGAPCRVVKDIVLVRDDEGNLVPQEVTDDWLAQDRSGNVLVCGELAREFEDGVLVSLEGSFEAGRDGAKAGTLLRADPEVGDADRQEFLIGDAEDFAQYLDLAATPTVQNPEDADEFPGATADENPLFPCAGECLKTLELNPGDPEVTEFKFYLPGTGFVLSSAFEEGDDGFELVEREELLCKGDSIEVLEDDPNCGIDDPEALLDTLCLLSPETDAFCGREEEDDDD